MTIKDGFHKMQQWFQESELDLVFIQEPTSLSYLTHFHTNPHERVIALVISKEASPLLFVPALEVNAAKTAQEEFEVIGYQDHQDPYQILAKAIQERVPSPKAWGLEKAFFSYQTWEGLSHYFPEMRVTTDISPVINQLRIIKSPQEVQALKASGRLADIAIQIGAKALKVGVKESEIAALIDYEMKKLGASQMSFSTMVLFGDHAADPHGETGDRVLEEGQWVLFDLGTILDGYASDITRTLFFGDPSLMAEEDRAIYRIVKNAHDSAMEAAKPGIKASQLDAIARDIIGEAGLGHAFIHRLGHGIGQSCHEFPSIMEGNDLVLEAGMCISIEPGVYLPGQIGVRVEDCVVITPDGCQSFTQVPYDYQEILNYSK